MAIGKFDMTGVSGGGMMHGVRQLGYVGSTATDLAAWRAYTVEVLGFEITPDSSDETLYLRVDDHHHRIAVHAGDSDDVAYVGWEVADPTELAAMVERIEAAGVATKQGTVAEINVRCVLDLAWFECPYTGVRTEVFIGPEVHFQPPFHPTRPIGGFVTGDQGLGHLVLYAPDLADAERFYAEVLGFATSDRVIVPGMGQIAAFMHCNSRHHSLGLMGIPGTPRRIQHVMFETLDIDTVGTTYDICVERDARAPRSAGIERPGVLVLLPQPVGLALRVRVGRPLDRPGDVAHRALQRPPAAG